MTIKYSDAACPCLLKIMVQDTLPYVNVLTSKKENEEKKKKKKPKNGGLLDLGCQGTNFRVAQASFRVRVRDAHVV